MGAFLPLCFVLSGASSLILQVVWVRKLVEIFGSSTLAIATVLASFMGGLALGAALGGRLADRFGADSDRARDDPFLYYGLAEALVGLTALAIPLLISGFRGPNAWLWSHLGDSPSLLALARFGLTALLLVIPTTAMGATLPLLTRRVSSRAAALDRLGRNLAILYAANTLGAVLGAALAGFALIPALGANATGQLAAALALGLAAVVSASVLLRSGKRSSPFVAPTPRVLRTPRRAAVPRHRQLAIAAYALSGAIAMSLEVLFSRALAIVNGSSVTSFTLVLVVFLAGISGGSALIAKRADDSDNPLALLGALLVGAAAAAAFSLLLIDDLPKVAAALLEGGRLEASAILVVHAIVTAAVIGPVALFLGAIMPVAIRTYVGSADRVGRDVGHAYAANTIGAILGSVVTGFFLMPALTIEGTLSLVIAADALMGAALLAVALYRRPGGSRRRSIAVVGVACAVACAPLGVPAWNKSDFTAGLFRTHIAREAIRSGELSYRDVVFYRDGPATTVSVEKLSDGVVVLKNNGKVEASSRVDMPTQILVGLVPVLLHGDSSKDVFVVGYGSGVTVGAIAAAPSVARINVAELEPAVYSAADAHFSNINRAPQRDLRVNRLVGDGRNILLAGGHRYDVIVSEPSNPWIAGVASLFTREFYQFARAHLADGGVFCQWAQLYELGPANVKMIYRTFAESFDYVYALTPGDEVTDTILIGAMQPIDLAPERLSRIIESQPSIRSELDRAGIGDAYDIIGSAFLLPAEVSAFTAGAAVNTDDSGALEYRAPLDLLNSATRASVARLVRSAGWPYGQLTTLVEAGDGDIEMAQALLEYGRRREARAFLSRSAAGERRDRVALLFELSRLRELADPELPVTSGGAPLAAVDITMFKGDIERVTDAAATLRSAYPLIAEAKWSAAHKRLAELPPRADSDEGRDVTLLIAYLAYKSLEFKRARDLLSALKADENSVARRPAILYYLGRSLYGLGSFRAGITALDEFARRFPRFARQASVDPFDSRARAPSAGNGDAKLEQ